jgi:hypothetical protein
MAKLKQDQVRRINEVTNVPFDTAQQAAILKALEIALERDEEKEVKKAAEDITTKAAAHKAK